MARDINDSVISVGIESIRIGVRFGESFLVGVTSGIKKIRENVDLSKGKVLYDKKQLVSSSLKRHKGFDTAKISLDDQLNEIKMLKRACRNAGIDIVVNKRPENMKEIFDRAMNGGDLSIEENELFNAFTIEDRESSGGRVLLENGFSVEFSARDFDKMEIISNQVVKRARGVAERSAEAKIKLEKIKAAKERAEKMIQKALSKKRELEK